MSLFCVVSLVEAFTLKQSGESSSGKHLCTNSPYVEAAVKSMTHSFVATLEQSHEVYGRKHLNRKSDYWSEEEPPEELPETKREPVPSSEILVEPAELLKPPKSTVESSEPTKDGKPEPKKTTTEPLEPEKKLISELPEEKPAEIPPEEPLRAPSDETAQDSAEELQDSG